jgi:hypothetical protein
MTRLIYALAAASLLAGCSATATTPAPTPTQEKPMNSSATLLPQRTVEVAPGATLRYDGAADSRCPPDVRCITAGEIAYKFTLTGRAGDEAFALTKAKPAFDAATVKGVRVTLGETAEPPLRPSTASAPVVIMPVTINITRP